MRFVELLKGRVIAAGTAGMASLVVLMAGCAGWSTDVPDKAQPGKPAAAPSPTPGAATMPNATGRKASAPIKLPPPDSPRSWSEARLQAARRLVAANPDQVYGHKTPDILLAIPVLSIELRGDGSVKHISVLRYPSQARETVDMAMLAIRRAAPFGDVSRLPKPWKFNETFLFNDDRRFKPMTLDQR